MIYTGREREQQCRLHASICVYAGCPTVMLPLMSVDVSRVLHDYVRAVGRQVAAYGWMNGSMKKPRQEAVAVN